MMMSVERMKKISYYLSSEYPLLCILHKRHNQNHDIVLFDFEKMAVLL